MTSPSPERTSTITTDVDSFLYRRLSKLGADPAFLPPFSEKRLSIWLQTRFGLGEWPKIRQEFYRVLVHSVASHGPIALWHIWDVANYAERGNRPDLLFCKSVAQRFNALGLFNVVVDNSERYCSIEHEGENR